MSNEILLGLSIHTPSASEFRYAREHAEAPEHPSSLILLDYWRACEARGGMRMGRDVPARHLAKILSGIAIIEPIDDWSDGRVRLAGMVYTTRFGRDITGMTIRQTYECDPTGGEALLNDARYCTTQRSPAVLRTRVLDGETELMRFEVITLPVRAADSDALWAVAGKYRT